jgi:hypothetical protein
LPREQRVEDAQIEAFSRETMAELEIGTGAELIGFLSRRSRPNSRPQVARRFFASKSLP